MKLFDNKATIIEQAGDLLRDESKINGGVPSKVFFPENIDNLGLIFRNASKIGQPVRFVGNHTGTTGGSVSCDNEWLISFSHMNRIHKLERISEDIAILTCDPGISLLSLNQFLQCPSAWSYSFPGRDDIGNNEFMYAPDPTEMNAQLGGTIATNASGARSFKFGSTRNSIHALSIMTVSGETATLHHKNPYNPSNGYSIHTENSKCINIPPIKYRSPEIKNASGLYVKDNMDAIDLLIGCEGTLCAFTSVELILRKKIDILAGCTFFTTLNDSLDFVNFLKKDSQILSIELFDKSALMFIDRYRKQYPSSLPPFPENSTQAILWEFANNTPESFESRIDIWDNEMHKCKSSFESTWSGVESHELAGLKQFRLALPETVNATVAQHKCHYDKIRKIGTDTALPENKFRDVYNQYLSLINSHKIEYASFGHIGDNHMHINLLPRNKQELELSLDIYDQLMKITIDAGGTVSAEHGIGIIKKKYLKQMYGDDAILQMKNIKTAFDPQWILNQGVMIDK